MSDGWRRLVLALVCGGVALCGLRLAAGGTVGDGIPDPVAPGSPTGEAIEHTAAGDRTAERARKLTPRVTPAMRSYSYWRYALTFAAPLYELAVLALILETRLSTRMRDAAARRLRRPFARATAFTVLFSAVYTALTFPLIFFSGWYLGTRYGLSRQSLPAWLCDGVKSFMVGLAIAAPLVWLLYLCLRRSPRRWWLGFWLASLPVIVFLVGVAPVVIDPLFHRFEPLRDADLREKILALAERAGIEGGRVYQVDMSEKTRALNAYVAGLGGTKRIVLWDTLLKRLKPDEILFVMGHEMAHYVRHHVPLLLAFGAAGLFFCLGLTDRAARALLRWRGGRWGVWRLEDLASLPLLLAVATTLQFAGMPIVAGVSRAMEREADAFGLQLTGNGEAAARAFVKLSEENLSLPSPPRWIVFWLFTHPPLNERINTALAEEGAPPTAGTGRNRGF